MVVLDFFDWMVFDFASRSSRRDNYMLNSLYGEPFICYI